MKKNSLWVVLVSVFILSGGGCAAMKEDAKILWGSSTKALEDERPQAVKKGFSCWPAECFDAVLKFANAENGESSVMLPAMPYDAPGNSSLASVSAQDVKAKNFDVFIKNRKRNMIVVMGVPGHVNTTEVGIFLTPVNGGTLIEVTSLSTAAKIKASEMIFAELAKNFQDLGI